MEVKTLALGIQSSSTERKPILDVETPTPGPVNKKIDDENVTDKSEFHLPPIKSYREPINSHRAHYIDISDSNEGNITEAMTPTPGNDDDNVGVVSTPYITDRRVTMTKDNTTKAVR